MLLFAAFKPDDIIGIWTDSQGKVRAQIFKKNGKYYGRIVWLKNAKDLNGKPKVDKNNPDPALRNKPVIGLVMLKDFRYDEEDEEWTDGHIYNPNDGEDYKAYMELKDKNTLSVRGYIGFSILGKTDIWKRVK